MDQPDAVTSSIKEEAAAAAGLILDLIRDAQVVALPSCCPYRMISGPWNLDGNGMEWNGNGLSVDLRALSSYRRIYTYASKPIDDRRGDANICMRRWWRLAVEGGYCPPWLACSSSCALSPCFSGAWRRRPRTHCHIHFVRFPACLLCCGLIECGGVFPLQCSDS